MKTNQFNRVIEALKNTGAEIDFNYFLEGESFSDFNEMMDILSDKGALDIEIIYYSKAITYLWDNDPSLKEAFRIASDLGYDIKNLNSEILASLLASEIEREKVWEARYEVNEILSDAIEELN